MTMPATAASPPLPQPAPPLVLHVLFRFATGGLENGVVNLVNRMDRRRFRHAILALDTVDAGFAARIERDDVALHALHKPPGHAQRLYPQVWRLLREMRPAVVHTRNLAALELQVPAWAAGVPARLHGEHGWDASDPTGQASRPRWIRRLYRPFVQRWTTVSLDLKRYLVERVGISDTHVEHVCNGVDVQRFAPGPEGPVPIPGCPFDPAQHWIVGTVGRLSPVKNQAGLIDAFAQALAAAPEMRARARLAIAGDGPLRAALESQVQQAGLGGHVWMAGERRDVPAVLRGLHLFALPSLGEGISNTILEAMASAVPVLATAVGGNPELVASGRTGLIVPVADAAALADGLRQAFDRPETTRQWSRQARAEAEQRFSLDAMVDGYARVYEQALHGHAVRAVA
jgi:sugar transferase (PEP-CTERM/EpsH1 system associated)